MAAVIEIRVGWIRFLTLAPLVDSTLGDGAATGGGGATGTGLEDRSWLCLSSSVRTLVNLVIRDEGVALLGFKRLAEGAGRSLLGVSQFDSPLPAPTVGVPVMVAVGVPVATFLVGSSRMYSQLLGISRLPSENFSRTSGLTTQQPRFRDRPCSLDFL